MDEKDISESSEFGADEAAALLQADLKAIKDKVEKGKPLSDAEIRRIRAIALGRGPAGPGADSVTPTADDEEGPKWTESQIDLAKILGIERKTIQRHLKKEDCPGKTPDGRYNIHEWRYWLKMRGRKGGQKKELDKNTLECQRILIENDLKALDLEIKRSKYTPNRDIEKWFGNFAFGIKTALLAWPGELAPDLATLFPLTPEQAETARGQIQRAVHKKVTELLELIAGGPWEWRQQLEAEKSASSVAAS